MKKSLQLRQLQKLQKLKRHQLLKQQKQQRNKFFLIVSNARGLIRPLFVFSKAFYNAAKEINVKKVFTSRIFIGTVCFILGAFMHHLYTKLEFNSQALNGTEREERIPVTPEDFSPEKMLEALSSMDRNMADMQRSLEEDFSNGIKITGVERKEDDKNVYYEIPLNASEQNHELKVTVKEGMISIREMTPNSESERQFSIDPGLDDSKAEVKTLQDKVLIRIPKKII